MLFSALLLIAAAALVAIARRRWRFFSLLVLVEIAVSVLVGILPVSGTWFPLIHSIQALAFMAVFHCLNNSYAPDYVQSLGLVVAIDLIAFGEYWLGLDIFYPVRPYLLAPVAVYQLWLSWRGGRDGGSRVASGFDFTGHLRRNRGR